MAVTRTDVVIAARSWLETPFHHMARNKGVGVDCAGLLVGVSRELGLVAAHWDTPAYTPTPDGRSMLALCGEYMTRIDRAQMQAGDVVLFVTDVDPQHLGILGDYRYGGFSVIHASNAARPPRVIETRLLLSRSLQFVAAYSLVPVH